jgi:hypothetical protein
MQPIILGDVLPYANVQAEMSTDVMISTLKRDAKQWPRPPLELDHIFQRKEGGRGYELKFRISIDHIVPQSMGGLDHPRNYLIVGKRINSHWWANVDEKAAVIGRSAMVKVHNFHKDYVNDPRVRATRAEYFRNLAPLPGY